MGVDVTLRVIQEARNIPPTPYSSDLPFRFVSSSKARTYVQCLQYWR